MESKTGGQESLQEGQDSVQELHDVLQEMPRWPKGAQESSKMDQKETSGEQDASQDEPILPKKVLRAIQKQTRTSPGAKQQLLFLDVFSNQNDVLEF